jgi:hypothetical protein
MISFKKPTNLNGGELRQELNSAGIAISDEMNAVVLDENQNLLLDIAEADKDKVTLIVAAHNGTIVAPEPTIAQKLESVGLSLDDLKAALGL